MTELFLGGDRVREKTFESKTLKTAKYDAVANVLTITFQNGNVYDYHGVPENVVEGLWTAESAGRYFQTFVKGPYRYVRSS